MQCGYSIKYESFSQLVIITYWNNSTRQSIHYKPMPRKIHNDYRYKWRWVIEKICMFIFYTPLNSEPRAEDQIIHLAATDDLSGPTTMARSSSVFSGDSPRSAWARLNLHKTHSGRRGQSVNTNIVCTCIGEYTACSALGEGRGHYRVVFWGWATGKRVNS